MAAKVAEPKKLLSAPGVPELIRTGRRQKAVRRMTSQLVGDVKRVGERRGVVLGADAQNTVRDLLLVVATAANKSSAPAYGPEVPQGARGSEARWAVRKLAEAVLTASDEATLAAMNGAEIEAEIAARCKWSLPPFCHA